MVDINKKYKGGITMERNETYDRLLREGIERMQQNPNITTLVDKKIEAFNTILNETNGTNLSKYYSNMEEFFEVMQDIILMDPRYLLTNEPHLCTGDNCEHKTVEEAEKDITDIETEE